MENYDIMQTTMNGLSNYCSNPKSLFSLFVDFLKGLHTTKQLNNINETIQTCFNNLDIIKETLLDKDFFLKTPIYEEDLFSVFQKVKDEEREEIRKIYAYYLTACRIPENVDCSNKTIYLRFIDQIDFLCIEILHSLSNYRTEQQIYGIINVSNKYKLNDIKIHVCNLYSALGLIERIEADEYNKIHRRGGNRRIMHSENIYLYKRNALGDGFYNFIIKGVPIEK